jgi:hypothetical protein
MGSCEHGNEILGFIKGEELFNKLSGCQFLIDPFTQGLFTICVVYT